MQNILSLGYKALRKFLLTINNIFDYIICTLLFYFNKVKHKKFETKGLPKLMVARGGNLTIGSNFRMNNSMIANPIGCAQPCMIFVDRGAILTIGENVQISQSAVVCHLSITIGNNVKLGGGVCIYDTDFHSLDGVKRANPLTDFESKKKSAVFISDNVFIGANTTVLKGVSIGENSIVGACSLITKNIPANEIWAGNPAKKLKNII